MLGFLQSRWQLLALWTGILIVLFVLGGLLFIWSGVYNVAANSEHFGISRSILQTTLRRSVATRSLMIDVPPLHDPDLVRLGGGHYQSGCAPCHGGPGQSKSPIVKNMLPAPPLLAETVRYWSPAELFWIVKHGLKYTGMPAWVAPKRDDEVWAVVAFLQKLPGLSPPEYSEMVYGNTVLRDRAAREIIQRGNATSAMTTCARCHEGADKPPTSRLVPRLAGQSRAYLERALREYASGKRASGIMQPVAAELAETEIRALASYYAKLSPQSGGTPRPPRPDETVQGRDIAISGVPERGIPRCLACHSGRAAGTFPLLGGQSAPYLTQQLELWQRGLRDDTAHGAIMAVIAKRLTEQEVAAVAAYFETAPPDVFVLGADAAVGETPR